MRTAERTATLIDTGLEFVPGDPVQVRVVHREKRTLVSDEGAAVKRTGGVPGWAEVAQRLAQELGVNISRHGTVSLPVVRVGPPEVEVIRRIGAASLALYQDLLELSG